MAQASPSSLFYAQALQLIEQLRQDYADNKFNTPQEISEVVKDILTRFDAGVGYTLTEFDPVYKSEIPRTDKMNKFWSSLQGDINVLQEQIDLLRASGVFTHNFIKTEIMKSKNANLRLQNKIKTLEMYSQSSDASLIIFGDNFLNDEFIDWTFVSIGERTALIGPGFMALAPDSQKNDLLQRAKVRLLGSSNGFSGNNQEILDPIQAPIDPVTKSKILTFKAESFRNAEVAAILDDEPNTWYEYESYKVDPRDRFFAGDLNFTYKVSETSSDTLGTDTSGAGVVDWANGPDGEVLNLEIEVDLQESNRVNVVTMLPFGLADNVNNPIRVVSVSISENGTDWKVLFPENLWIVNGIDKKLSFTGSESVVVNSATWVTDGDFVRFIRFKIQQSRPINANVGHLYYVTEDTAKLITSDSLIDPPSLLVNEPFYDMNIIYNTNVYYEGNATPNTTPIEQPTEGVGFINPIIERVEGPVPPVEQPDLYYDPRNLNINDLVQRREYFKGKRWAIGIRDINVRSNEYKEESVFVSKKFEIPGIIDRVALEADVSIPIGYDQTTAWVKFYVSPNEGATWFQISRIQDDFLGIPEIIAFNDPTPAELRESGVSYFDIPGLTVKALRLKVEITRPSENKGTTPILKSYALKVKKR